jgi:hypothetical protein
MAGGIALSVILGIAFMSAFYSVRGGGPPLPAARAPRAPCRPGSPARACRPAERAPSRCAVAASYPQARSVVFAGDDSLIFEGVVTMVACVMLTSVSFALLRMLSMQRKWEERLTVSTKARRAKGSLCA